MRLAVVSDIHGNLPALEAVLAEVRGEHVDRVVNLGDIVSGPLWPRETAALLRAMSWSTIRGNHERQLLALAAARMGATDAFARARLDGEGLRWLAALPATLDLGDGVWCCHGTPASDLQYFLETVTPDLDRDGSPGVRAATAAEVADRLGAVTAPLVLCGHTHMPRAAQCGGTLVVNPGSVGLPAFDDEHPYAHRMETGSPHARWALVERAEAGWQVQQRLTAYDWPLRRGGPKPKAVATGPMRCAAAASGAPKPKPAVEPRPGAAGRPPIDPAARAPAKPARTSAVALRCPAGRQRPAAAATSGIFASARCCSPWWRRCGRRGRRAWASPAALSGGSANPGRRHGRRAVAWAAGPRHRPARHGGSRDRHWRPCSGSTSPPANARAPPRDTAPACPSARPRA
ncbi:MAG: metallophosphoesterase family protein [Betaproteobacteria bacterium]|nr:metallophosphoesterase family protein [Betaproteobacteria bacterium]